MPDLSPQCSVLGDGGPLVPDVRKIAVVRANALGDYLFAVPALEALAAAYPGAELVLVGTPWHADYLAGRPGPVDRVVVAPPRHGVRNPTADEPEDPERLEEFFADMHAESFDLALQLHGGGGNSNPFTARLGARVTAGLCAPGAPPLDRTMPYTYYQHEVLRLLEVVGLVGAAPVRLEPVVAVTADDVAEADEAVGDLTGPIAVLHPGAADTRRRWPAESFAAVGDLLAGAGASVVVTGTPGERDTVDAVVAAMRAPARSLCGRVGLRGLTGVLARAAVVVSNDTGPRHLAAAVGASTVGIYWCGNLINAGPFTRARHRPHLSWRLTCPVCGVSCVEGENADQGGCAHRDSFVADVPATAVAADALALLERATGDAVGVSDGSRGSLRTGPPAGGDADRRTA